MLFHIIIDLWLYEVSLLSPTAGSTSQWGLYKSQWTTKPVRIHPWGHMNVCIKTSWQSILKVQIFRDQRDGPAD